MRRSLLVVASLPLALAAVAASATTSAPRVEKALAAAGCTLRHVKPIPPATGNFHSDAPTLKAKVKWSTFPPSAGAHYARWAVWGFYRKAVNPRMVVHNLEHGGVVIWWGPKVPVATVDRLEAFYRTSPVSMLGTPLPGLGDKVALTAWVGNPATYYRNGHFGVGQVAVCPRFDSAAFAAFRAAYRNKGPEGVSPDYNKPGMGPG
jgi:hypothetical protein